MSERERLIELLQEWSNKENDGVRAESIADYLLGNGNIHDNPNLCRIEHDSLCETETYKAGDEE